MYKVNRSSVEIEAFLPFNIKTTRPHCACSLLQFTDSIPNGAPDTQSLDVDASAVCPEGQVLVDAVCVQCSVGTFYDTNADPPACRPCQRGSYQDQPGQTGCVGCASGFTTELEGSQSIDDCALGLWSSPQRFVAASRLRHILVG